MKQRSFDTIGARARHRSGWLALTMICMLYGAVCALNAQTLTWLGTLGGKTSETFGVSNNRIVVGWANNAKGWEVAFGSQGVSEYGWMTAPRWNLVRGT